MTGSARIYTHHCSAAGYCFSHVREACKRYGIDYSRLRKEGVPIEEVEQIDDLHVKKLIELARGN